MTAHVIYDQAQIEERLAYWQKRLRLQDWHITVEVCRMREIDDNEARIFYKRSHRTAHIWIGDGIDYNPSHKLPLDMEVNLVHELLHIHFSASVDYGEPLANLADQETEAGIDMIAYALVQLERERGGKPHAANTEVAAAAGNKPPE